MIPLGRMTEVKGWNTTLHCTRCNIGTLRACLEVLAGERSYSYTLDRRPVFSSSWEGRSLRPSAQQLWEGCKSVREEGDTGLASQISLINPGDQWGDRCHIQIALTPMLHYLNFFLNANKPWTGGSVGWSIILCTRRLRVQSPVGAHPRNNQSMPLSLPLPLSKTYEHILRSGLFLSQ